MTGNIHSINLSARWTAPACDTSYLCRGCPLRCVYCHNPDTWLTEGGTPTDVDELVERLSGFVRTGKTAAA